MRLDGKIGIVTAAASGMGRAGALRFAKEGAAVAVVDHRRGRGRCGRRRDHRRRRQGDRHRRRSHQDDFARDIVRRTANEFGGLDFVWNHVGHPGPAAIEGIDMADFDIAIDLNLRTVLVTTEAAIPEMRARGGGALLYHRLDLGAGRLGVQPGLFDGEIRRRRLCPLAGEAARARQHPGQRGLPRPDRHADAARLRRPSRPARPGRRTRRRWSCSAARQIPMRRTGKPEEIANAALFLLSDEASFVSGAALPVDGGATALIPPEIVDAEQLPSAVGPGVDRRGSRRAPPARGIRRSRICRNSRCGSARLRAKRKRRPAIVALWSARLLRM